VRAALLVLLTVLPHTAQARPKRWEALPLPEAMPVPREAAMVDVADGAKIYVARFGTPDGSPVVLLHGGMGNGDHWANQIPALVATHDVIVIDSRGHGRSTRTKAKPTYDVMADDVVTVLDHLKIEKAAFVGWSDGGEVALKLAIHHADRVTKLFVLAANYNAKGAKPHAAHTTFTIYGKKCRADYVRLSPTPKQYDAMVSWLRPLWHDPMNITKAQLRSIAVPTVMADGDHDEIIVLDQVKEMAQLIPHAKLEVFANASHFVLWQDAKALNNALIEFLE
jgi:pimeloyl-ACP methyl ester carboxylesterase